MHLFRFITFNIVRHPAITTEQLIKFIMTNPCKHCWISYFVPIEMQNWQNCPISDRIKKFIGVPCSRQWSCFSFSISDNACNNQLRVIEDGSEGMTKRIP